MWRLKFWVACDSWIDGGYPNTHYFKTKADAIRYAKDGGHKILELDKVTYEEFAEDYIPSL